MNKSHLLIFLRTQAAFILSCLLLYSCENDPKKLKELTEKKVTVEEAKNIDSYLSENGRMKARLLAPVMLRYTSDTQMIEFPKKLHVNFFDSTGQKLESQLDALYGKYYEGLNKVYLRDSVVVFNVKGDTLRTPELWWDQNTQKFYTEQRVRIHKNGDRIYGGQGMEARQDLSDINIKQPTGTVIVKDSLSH